MSHLVELLVLITKSRDRYPVGNYLFKVNSRNSRISCEICSKLTIRTPEHNSEHILHLVLVFLSLTLNRRMSTGQNAFYAIDSITEFKS